MKKVLSLVLVIAMVLSSMSFAFAGTFTDVANTDYAKAIETLTALGVVSGYEDGTYRPEKTVTRAEMAKLIVEILGYGDLVAGSKSQFTDTQGHWADAWIALAAGKGLVLGTGDGKFTPDRTVSYDEAITMVVRALGYTDASNELKNMTWPTNFKVKAAELGLTKDVKLATSGADRGGVAQLLYNALTATLVTVNSDGDVVKSTTQTTDSQGKVVVEYTELLSRIADYDSSFEVTTEVLDPNNKNYAGDKVDLAPYMFQNLKVYLNDDDEVVYVKGSNSLVLEGVIDSVTTTAATTVVAVEDANEKVTKVVLNTTSAALDASDVFENGSLRETDKNFFDTDALENVDTIKIVATDAGNKDGKIQGSEVEGYVTTFQTKVVRIEQAYVEGKTKIDRIALPLNDDDEVDFDNVTVKGDAESLEDIKADDIVVEYLSEDETVTTLVVTRNSVEGKVNRVDSGAGYYYVNGTKYKLNAVANVTLALGDEGVFYFDQDGKIADFDGEAAGPTNYAVVVAAPAGGEAQSRFGYSIKTYPQLKLATQEGETVIYDIQVKMDTDGSVSGSAKVDGVAIIATSGAATDVDNATDKLAITGIGKYDLIKYSLNADGRISKVSVVENDVEAVLNGLVAADAIDLEKVNNELASNAVVFDATDKEYDVVDESTLPSKVMAYVVRNNNGQIIVLVAKDGEVGSAVTQYAYITKVNPAYNDDGDEVKAVELYIDGVKKTVYTTTDIPAEPTTTKKVYQVKFDGSDLDLATIQNNATAVTASAINAKAGMIEIGGNWKVVADNATILGIDVAKKYNDRRVTDFRDLYDITKESTVFEVYMNSDSEICLILIHE